MPSASHEIGKPSFTNRGMHITVMYLEMIYYNAIMIVRSACFS